MKKKILGLVLLLAMFFGFGNINYRVVGYEAPITVSGAVIVIDIYHEGYHTTAEELAPFIGNLTAAGNQVILLNETWDFPMNASALFLPGSEKNFTDAEKETIKNWLAQGDKLLFVGGDSDYGGYFAPTALNDLLDYIGTVARLGRTSISDPVYNDGASYRVGVKDFGDSDLAKALTQNMEGGFILHGPSSVVGFDGTYYKDLRYSSFSNLDIIVYFSENSTSSDSDVSDTELDLYANGPYADETGNYPAVVYEHLIRYDSHMIIAGECPFTHYKRMYDQTTEKGEFQNGTTYGQMFINNIVNYFVKPVPQPTTTTTTTETTTEEGTFFAVLPFAFISSLYALLKRRKR